MKNLLKFVQNINAQEHLWSRGDSLLIGVSGGADSMCLLNLMAQLTKKENLMLVVAHVNYGLRGEASDADENNVRATCEAYHLPLHVKMIKNEGLEGSEALWRKQRYAYFEEVRRTQKADHIVVAHNANDQAETLLLHLLRGTSLNGLQGMRHRRSAVIRPFLKVQRKDILRYCEDHHITFAEDKTNSDNSFTRNHIRNELLPFLQKGFNREIIKTLSVTADQVSVDYNYLEEMARKCLPSEFCEVTVAFSAKRYCSCHRALQRVRLHQIIVYLQKDDINVTSRNIAELHKAIASIKNKHQNVKMRGLKMQRKGDTVKFTTK